MIDKRSAYERCMADLEMAQMVLNNIANGRDASEDQIRKAAIEAKKLEVKLAAAKLAQAEYHLDALSARLEFLERRCADAEASSREQAELQWARSAVPVNGSTTARLTADLKQRKQELENLLAQPEMAGSF
jgi:hypothetical protein